MAETKSKKVDVQEIREAKGFVTVKFLKKLGTNSEGSEAELHKSTALSLEQKGYLKITGDVKEYTPKKAKK